MPVQVRARTHLRLQLVVVVEVMTDAMLDLQQVLHLLLARLPLRLPSRLLTLVHRLLQGVVVVVEQQQQVLQHEVPMVVYAAGLGPRLSLHSQRYKRQMAIAQSLRALEI